MLLAVVVGRLVTELRPPTVMESDVAAESAPGGEGRHRGVAAGADSQKYGGVNARSCDDMQVGQLRQD
jgi:hypothetical protein